VGLSVEGPAGPLPPAAPQLFEPGEWPLASAPLGEPGRHVVSIVADAGVDRVTTVTVPVTVAPAGEPRATSAALAGSAGRGAGRSLPVWIVGLVAFVLWAPTAVLGTRRARLARRGG